MNEEIRIAAPDQRTGGQLLAALAELEAALQESEAGWEVIVSLKSPNTGPVLVAITKIVERWLTAEGLASTRMHVGNPPPMTVRSPPGRGRASGANR